MLSNLEQQPLAKQVDFVIEQLAEELKQLTSGIVFMQIRNNVIGKFGIKHDPIECREGVIRMSQTGLTDTQVADFKRLAVQALAHKKNWTHGEMMLEFALKHNILIASIVFESNYNLSAMVMKWNRKEYNVEKIRE